jgi:hypothetical protein
VLEEAAHEIEEAHHHTGLTTAVSARHDHPAAGSAAAPDAEPPPREPDR